MFSKLSQKPQPTSLYGLLSSTKLVHLDGKRLICFIQNLVQNSINLIIKPENKICVAFSVQGLIDKSWIYDQSWKRFVSSFCRHSLKFLKKRSQFCSTCVLCSSKLIHAHGKKLTSFIQNLVQNSMNLFLSCKSNSQWLEQD